MLNVKVNDHNNTCIITLGTYCEMQTETNMEPKVLKLKANLSES